MRQRSHLRYVIIGGDVRNVLIGIIVFNTLVIFLLFGFKEQVPVQQLVPVEPKTELTAVVPKAIQSVNEKNKRWKNIHCNNVTIKIWSDGLRYKVNGTVNYEKDKNFRMILRSLFGVEVDCGSNDKLFWYWSKKDPDKGLHYAYHEDYVDTRLKTVFNPMFIKSSLGLDQIDLADAKIVETETYFVVYQKQKSPVDVEVYYLTYIDKQKETIKGFVITDLNYKPIATCEVTSDVDGLPMKVVYYWHLENKVMSLEFNKLVSNLYMPVQYWEMPNYQPQKDMTEDWE